jgi:hypothetical protein
LYLSRHFKDLCTIEQEEEEPIINATTDENVGIITLEELTESMKYRKNKKAPGCDRINLELIKYALTAFHYRSAEYMLEE